MRKKDSLGVGLEYKIGFVSSLSATVIWILLGSLWSLIAANIISLLQNKVVLPWQYFVAGISIGVALTASVVFYKDKTNKFKPKFPSLSMDYMYKKIDTEIHFITREEITYTSCFNILALKEIKGMKRTHEWTGTTISELPIIKSKTSNHKVELCKDEPRKTINVIFEVPLQKNHETDCILMYELGDSLRKMQPFLGHVVKNPTEKIILRLCVPKGMVTSVKKCIYADSSAQISLSLPQIINPRYIGNIEMYEWEIDNPSLLYFYRMNWEFV